MKYDLFQSCLLIPVELTRSECASWVQALGSIFTIAAAIGVAIYQANRQQEITRQAILDQEKTANIHAAEALEQLAKLSLALQKHFETKLKTQNDVYEAGTYGMISDIAMLQGLEQFLYAIELHKLPLPIIRLALIVASNVRNLRVKVEQVIRINRKMRTDEFEDFFQTLQGMTASLERTLKEIKIEVGKIQNSTNHKIYI